MVCSPGNKTALFLQIKVDPDAETRTLAGARHCRSRAGSSDLAPEPGPESGSGLDEQKVGVEWPGLVEL